MARRIMAAMWAARSKVRSGDYLIDHALKFLTDESGNKLVG
jgi:hypothetical protein